MKIRVGYELIYDFPQPTPMIMVLVHRFHETGHLRGIHCDSIALYAEL
jgi:hypothetical protein